MVSLSRSLEICVDTVTAAVAAARAGADRIELCENLARGGVTPSAGKIRLAKERLDVPVFVLVRPRPGDFFYSEEEFELLLTDIRLARELGADGIVSGAIGMEGQFDRQRTRRMIEAAAPLPFTFHRAFDHLRDPHSAIDALADLGCARILTAGGAGAAAEGAPNLARYVEWAAGRLRILAGGGVRPHNARTLLAIPGLTELHSSARQTGDGPPEDYARREMDWETTDPEAVRQLKALLRNG